MSRRHRVDVDGAIHHVMNRGVDHRSVFFSDTDRVEFGRRLASIHADFGVETLAYCLMGNHYHLLLHTPRAGLSDAMQQLGSVYTRHTNDRVGRDGPLFRGRFHSILVTTDLYLTWVARYIHRNPLSIPDVAAPCDYRWSSYRTYLGHRATPSFMSLTPLLERFDGDLRRIAAFTDDPTVRFALGDGVRADDVRQLVEFVIADDDIRSSETADDERVLARPLLLLLAADGWVGSELSAAILDLLEFPSDSARRMALSRARRRLASDPVLARMLSNLLDHAGARELRAA